MENEVVLTTEGLERLKTELEYLRAVKRKEVTEKIREALAFGDPWENPEYESAKNEQAFIEGRIMTLENMMGNAKVIQESASSDAVQLGSTIKLADLATGEALMYTIVGANEADPLQGKISYLSPVGQAVLGRRQSDRVCLEVPAGTLEYEIVEVKGGTQ